MGILFQRHTLRARKLISGDLIHLGSWKSPRERDVGAGTLRTSCGPGALRMTVPANARPGAHPQQMWAPLLFAKPDAGPVVSHGPHLATMLLRE